MNLKLLANLNISLKMYKEVKTFYLNIWIFIVLVSQFFVTNASSLLSFAHSVDSVVFV